MKILYTIIFIFSYQSFSKVHKYRGGDKYSKTKVKRSLFLKSSPIVKDIIQRTGKVVVGRKHIGTAFLYKEREDDYVFLTNYHVMKSRNQCRDSKILIKTPEFGSKILICSGIIKVGKISKNTDYMYFSVSKNRDNLFLSKLKPLKLIDQDPLPGDKLIVAGFGAGKVSSSVYDLKITMDNDCVYFVGNRTIVMNGKDVEDVMFHGCDTASGDSGSAIINRDTGELVGLLFGSASQKKQKPLSSEEIEMNLGTPYRKFMTNGSFAIDIREILI